MIGAPEQARPVSFLLNAARDVLFGWTIVGWIIAFRYTARKTNEHLSSLDQRPEIAEGEANEAEGIDEEDGA